MAPSCMLCKHEDLVSITRTHEKSGSYACNPSPGGMCGDPWCSLASQPNQRAPDEGQCLKTQGRLSLKNDIQSGFSSGPVRKDVHV